MPRKPTHPEEPERRDVATDYHDDDWVEVFPADGLIAETCVALLETADRLGYDPGPAVHAIGGGFRVPRLVADTVEYPTQPAPREPQIVPTPMAALDKGAIRLATDAPS